MLKLTVRTIAFICAVLLWGGSPALAAPKSDKTGPSASESKSMQDEIAGVVFTEIERRVLCDYYKIISCGTANRLEEGKEKIKGRVGSKDKTALLPPGLAKRDALPPGLEKQYQRNGKLPPGLEKRQLPEDLARRLPPRHASYERVIVDNDVLLIQVATGLILDILEGVAAGR